jgi:hypothetical protein
MPTTSNAVLKMLNADHKKVQALFAQTEALAFGKTDEEVHADGVPSWL